MSTVDPLERMGASLAEDANWIQQEGEKSARITLGTIKRAFYGVVIFIAFFILSISYNAIDDYSTPLQISPDSSTALGAYAVLIAASSLFTTIAASITMRIRDHKDREIAQYARPIIFASNCISLFVPLIALTSTFPTSPSHVDFPMLIIGIVTIIFVCFMSALTEEFLELGPELNEARTKIESGKRADHRTTAAQRLFESTTAARRPEIENAIFLHGLSWGSTGVVTYFTVRSLDIPASSFGLGIIATITMTVIVTHTYQAQVSLRRGRPIDAAFTLLVALIWSAAAVLVGGATGHPEVALFTVLITLLSWTTSCLLFSSRFLARTCPLVSLRRAVAWRLLRDAEAASANPTKPREPRLLSWYWRVTGTSRPDASD